MINGLFKSQTGKNVVAIILGLGLAAMFRKTCVGEQCVVVRAPDTHKVAGQTFKYKEGCYEFTPEFVECPGV